MSVGVLGVLQTCRPPIKHHHRPFRPSDADADADHHGDRGRNPTAQNAHGFV